ncbi:hypothetical protein, partial [Amycolatopsis sp. NPDC000740]
MTRSLNTPLIASAMQPVMLVSPQSGSPFPVLGPPGCGLVLGGGVGCGMQSSPVHGGFAVVLGAVAVPPGVHPIWPGKQLVGGGSVTG